MIVHGLASAASKLCSVPGGAKLIFAMPPDASIHDYSRQNPTAIRARADEAALARAVEQYLVQIPNQPRTSMTYPKSPAAQPMET